MLALAGRRQSEYAVPAAIQGGRFFFLSIYLSSMSISPLFPPFASSPSLSVSLYARVSLIKGTVPVPYGTVPNIWVVSS